jgi:hypothetical protein
MKNRNWYTLHLPKHYEFRIELRRNFNRLHDSPPLSRNNSVAWRSKQSLADAPS